MEVLAHFTANTACHLNIRVAGNSQVINMKRRLKKHSKTKENKERVKVKSMIITVWIPGKYMQTQKYFPSRCETVRQDVWATHHLSWSLWPPEALRFYSILRVTSMWLTSVQYTSIQVLLVYKCTVYIHYIYKILATLCWLEGIPCVLETLIANSWGSSSWKSPAYRARPWKSEKNIWKHIMTSWTGM